MILREIFIKDNQLKFLTKFNNKKSVNIWYHKKIYLST